jgi:hypothetical protein
VTTNADWTYAFLRWADDGSVAIGFVEYIGESPIEIWRFDVPAEQSGAKVWLPAVRAAGLEPLRPHDLRHTAVALWIAAGANPKEVAARAGHTSVSFTLDRYGHLFEGHDAELRDRLDNMHAIGLQDAAEGSILKFQPGPFRRF